MNRLGLFRHVPFGIDVFMELLPGGHMIDQFDTTDFDDSVSRIRAKARGFRIKDDFTQYFVSPYRAGPASFFPANVG